MYSPVFDRFIDESDEMVHVVFPDESYNKPKLTTTCRDGVWNTKLSDSPIIK